LIDYACHIIYYYRIEYLKHLNALARLVQKDKSTQQLKFSMII